MSDPKDDQKEVNPETEEKKTENVDEPKIRDSDVQDIIKMMKDDLNLVKLKSKNDQTSLNDLDSPKSSRISNNYSENYVSTIGLNSESSKEATDTSCNDNARKTSESNETEDEAGTSNYYSDLNDTTKNDTQSVQEKEDIKETSSNDELKDSKENDKPGSPRDGSYYNIVKTCCENMNCTSCKDKEATKMLVDDMDEYEKEFQIDETDPNYKEIVDFIEKAKEFGANALDLSKKNLIRIPKNLLDLKHLEYIYLEGNNLKKLPKNFFTNFKGLKWLDLRNNQLIELPTSGLDDLENLRSLLLENNQISKLPDEIANIRSLSALSVSENPIEYPTVDIVNKGFKHVQQFMRGEILRKQLSAVNTNNKNLEDLIKDAEDEYYEIQSITDDVWASDGEETARQSMNSKLAKQTPCETPVKEYLNSANQILVTKTMNPADTENPNLLLRERLEKARLSANLISRPKAMSRSLSSIPSADGNGRTSINLILNKYEKSRHQNLQNEKQKLLTKRSKLAPVEIAVYKNEELEKALRAGNLEKYKKSKEEIDAKIQKINDFKMVDDFRNDLKIKQRQMAYKRITKGVDYIEPVYKSPYDVSEEHKMVMTNEQREFVDKKLAENQNRALSPDALWRVEEQRRSRDHELESKIKDYKHKLLARRSNKGKSSNPKNDRVQAARDLKELKLIEKELNKRRAELQHNFRSFTGDCHYKEMEKMDAKTNLNAILRAAKLNPNN